MKFLVKYFDFHEDNYQGGSGQTVQSQFFLELSHVANVEVLQDILLKEIHERIRSRRPFDSQNDHKPTIVSIEVLL